MDYLTHYPILPFLIRSARTADPTAKDYDLFLNSALRSTAVLINKRGYDPNESLHCDALQWFLSSSVSDNIEIAASSIWALGDLGIPPYEVRDQLEMLIQTDARTKNDDNPNTCRAVAFRMLARLDRETAGKYIDSAASREFQNAIAYWLEHYRVNYPTNDNVPRNLRAESEWLHDAG